jgi:HEAT repeat protein
MESPETDRIQPPAPLAHLIALAVDIQRAAPDDTEHEEAWPVIEAMKDYGGEALKAGLALLESEDATERVVGCDLLGQLSNPGESLWGPEVASALVRLAERETDTDVWWSLAGALGHTWSAIGAPVLARLASHPDAGVRLQVACALPNCAEGADPELAVPPLLALMEDEDELIRDWATFAIARQMDVDGHHVRDALAAHVDDDDPETRDEALVGLARRRDPRALPIVVTRLQEASVGELVVEAASYLGDPRLLPILEELAHRWDLDVDRLARALVACDPDRQQERAREQEAFTAELHRALAERSDGASGGLFCERMSPWVGLVLERPGREVHLMFDSLVRFRGDGDIPTAVKAILSDLDRDPDA